MSIAKLPTSKQFERELRNNILDRIYLFTGEEDGEKEKFIKKIIDMAFENEDAANYSVGRFHAENDEFQDACEFALSQSMFSERKVCLLLNIQHLKSMKKDTALFNELIDNLPDSNILIMTSSENKVPGFLGGKTAKRIKIVQFWRYFENDLYSYITNSIKKHGLNIERSAANLLIDLLGRDIKKIDSAIEKMAYCGETSITANIVETYIQFEKDVSVFDFINAFFKKERKAITLLVKLIENGTHELAVLSLIFRQAEMIEKYHFFIKEGMSTEDAVQKIGVFPRNRKDFIEQTINYSSDKISNIFPMISNTDYRIKSSNYSNSLLENPVFELVTNVLL